MSGSPAVSFVVPARNEESYLAATLESIRAQETDRAHEVLVVDGNSEDATVDIAREHGAALVAEPGRGIGHARHVGARVACGEWLAFIDADTILDPVYLDMMFEHVREHGLRAASSRCRIRGWRAKPMQVTINRVFPRFRQPILPGFNFFVERATYEAAGGFPNVPNEDTAFSRRLARTEPTGYCPLVLVETSPRRIREVGLTRTLWHYLRLDWGRYRADY